MDYNINDSKNIVGLSNLISGDDLESNMDLAEIEREIANGAAIETHQEVNIADEYKKEMDKFTRNFDMNISNNNDIIDSVEVPSPEIDFPIEPEETQNYQEEPTPYSRNMYNSNENEWNPMSSSDAQITRMTQEEKKQSVINNVLNDIDAGDVAFNIEKEKDEDDKASLLEQIDMLKTTLDDDGIDISGVPNIDKRSSMKEVHDVYKILRLKNDRNRYCSFAEEVILSGAYGMEYLFDGKKEWFNRRPDLTGWSSTVKVKLRRLRFETSTFVKEVMQDYNMSPSIRLLLELLPSMFLYSRNRRLSQDDNLVSDSDYKNAISQLNSI